MSSKILTHCVIDIDAFMRDPRSVLRNAEGGTIAVFANNIPEFYAITPARLAQLLELETRVRQVNDVAALDMHFFEKPVAMTGIPMGKFPMYSSWQPGKDFQRQVALWGIHLTKPITPEELTAFIAWWQAEGKVFTHIQWQQKLARSVQISRSISSSQQKRDINTFSQPDTTIPYGFRGTQ